MVVKRKRLKMNEITNFYETVKIFEERERIINEGTKEEITNLAKEFDIFQDSTHAYYTTMVDRITARLTFHGVDVNTLK